jgi:hypothetical protein
MAAPADQVWDLVSDVTECFEVGRTLVMRLYWALAGFARGRTNRNGMRATLEAIRTVTETAAPAP